MKRWNYALGLLAAAVAQAHAVDGISTEQWTEQERTANQNALKAVSQMSNEEKLSFLSGTGGWDVQGVPKLGIPQSTGADGGVGIRYTSNGNPQGVVYPSGPNLAATWNPRRAVEFGRALGYDAATAGYQSVTGPGITLYRMPYNGRAFEYLSGEDPFIGASLAPAVVNGIQSRGVWATAKHYAVNDQESNRFNLNEIVPERVLREMSLPPFESAAKNSKVAIMMCAFQKVNGHYACESEYLIKHILKKEWGYTGFVQSDYNAIVNGLNAAKAGTDVDMLFGYQMNSKILKPYLDSGELTQADLDDKVRRVLMQAYLFGFDKKTPLNDDDMDSAESNQASLNTAREGIVLLKNKDQLLPLNPKTVKSIAVVGNLAKYAPPTGFGSANVEARNYISELSGIQQVAPRAKVDFIDALSLDPLATKWTHLNEQGDLVKGLKAEYFTNANWSGAPASTRTETYVDLDWANGNNLPTNGDVANTSVRWSGKITPTQSGDQIFKVRADGAVRVTVNGQEIINNGDGNALPGGSIPPTIPVNGKITLEAGKTYDIKLDYSRRNRYISTMGGLNGVQMSWASLAAPQDLSKYDAVMVAVGNSNEYEGEGFDHGFELPEYQNELIRNVAKVNPNTIVTLHGGTALKASDWIDDVAGTLHAFYPGQNGGQALAEILFGKVNPSAKLPISIERNIEDNPIYATFPAYDNYKQLKEMSYKDDLMLGYRGYEKKGIKPLYPFGYGLSYTSFSYSDIKVTPGVAVGNAPIKVSFAITNTGKRAGSEVAQLYVGQANPKVERAIKELKGYKKLKIEPGQTRRVTIELNDRSLAYYDDQSKQWVVDADTFNISVGASSADIRLNAKIVNPYRQELSTTTSNPLPRSALNQTKVTAAHAPTLGNIYDQENDDGSDSDDGSYSNSATDSVGY
ncbi:beta-glucosidase [Pseudomonas sp. ICMP 561]|nr:glycoside hydrolase family 3 C-terminal domain-containing protein [Pseudomonas sp. ICMP 561]PHN17280.1 beta-glucosidase [Pseudomonas sp. ICMP 561]